MSKLEDFQVDGPSSFLREDPTADTIRYRQHIPARVLAFDQACADTGWAFLHGMNTITGNIRPGSFEGVKQKSHEELLMRGRVVFSEARVLIARYQPVVIFHEAPPLGSKVKGAGESSLTAAMAIHAAAEAMHTRVVIIQGQKMKKRLTGKHTATKQQVSAAVKALHPEWETAKPGPLNEHTMDAVGLGLVGWTEEG